jgi:energy-coupling factor transport system substrate-specific component
MSELRARTRFTTLDIIVIAVTGIVWGLLGGPLGYVWQTAMAGAGPIVGAFFAPFVMSITLGILLVRKPGSGVLGGILNGMAQWLGGNPLGVSLLVFGLVMGIGAELIFFLTRYRKFTWPVAFASSGIAQVFALIQAAVMFGWGTLGPAVVIGTWVITFFASGIESGLLAYLLYRLIRNSGALSP